jgi:hypothetical protein
MQAFSLAESGKFHRWGSLNFLEQHSVLTRSACYIITSTLSARLFAELEVQGWSQFLCDIKKNLHLLESSKILRKNRWLSINNSLWQSEKLSDKWNEAIIIISSPFNCGGSENPIFDGHRLSTLISSRHKCGELIVEREWFLLEESKVLFLSHIFNQNRFLGELGWIIFGVGLWNRMEKWEIEKGLKRIFNWVPFSLLSFSARQ